MTRGVAIPPFIRAWIRRNYEHNPNMSLVEMARHAGCTSSAVPHMASREGWRRAPGAVRSRTGKDAAERDTAAASLGLYDTAGERRMVLDALWLVASRCVAELQSAGVEAAEDGDTPETATGTAPGPARDRTRDAQALMTTVRTVEKLMDMEADLARSAPAAHADEGPEDIDEFRNAIAQRLEAMLASPPGREAPLSETSGREAPQCAASGREAPLFETSGREAPSD